MFGGVSFSFFIFHREAIAKFKAEQEAQAREAAAHPAPEHGAGSEDDEASD